MPARTNPAAGRPHPWLRGRPTARTRREGEQPEVHPLGRAATRGRASRPATGWRSSRCPDPARVAQRVQPEVLRGDRESKPGQRGDAGEGGGGGQHRPRPARQEEIDDESPATSLTAAATPTSRPRGHRVRGSIQSAAHRASRKTLTRPKSRWSRIGVVQAMAAAAATSRMRGPMREPAGRVRTGRAPPVSSARRERRGWRRPSPGSPAAGEPARPARRSGRRQAGT